MQLYYKPGACALAVHIVLEWLGVDYTLTLADAKDPVFQSVNPLLAVPALVTDELGTLTQCDAILAYLTRLPGGAVYGATPDDDAKRIYDFSFWSAYLTGDVHPAFFPFFMQSRFTIDTDDTVLAHIKASAPKRVEFVLQVLEKHLANRQFVIGDQKSIIDAYCIPMVRWAKGGMPEVYARLPSIAKHYDMMMQDAGVQRAMQQQGINP